MQLTSTAFEPADSIPVRYTAEGDNISPPLLWSGLPTGTVSLALLCEDPDAPERPHQDHPVVHWVLYNIDPDGMLPEGLPHEWKITDPIYCEQGLNSLGRAGYSGPHPPPGHGAHRYFFRLFALSRLLKLPARAMKEHLLDEMQGAVLATTELVGLYEAISEKQPMPKSA